MDRYLTGATIKGLRERRGLTQAQLAELLNVSDKAVSKWETGAGYPDITLLEPIAGALRVSVAELLAGAAVENANVSANMLKSRFYACPVCGNSIHAMGCIRHAWKASCLDISVHTLPVIFATWGYVGKGRLIKASMHTNSIPAAGRHAGRGTPPCLAG